MFFRKYPYYLLVVGVFLFSGNTFGESDYVFKVSPSYYAFSNGVYSTDLNLRVTKESSNFWLGYTKEFDNLVSQYRWGVDHREQVANEVYLLSSVQNASGGLWAGVIGFEYGTPWFVNALFGRTNLNTYWNLNFDPNDSYQIGFGKKSEGGDSFSFFHVHDNRQNPSQSNTHALYKSKLQSGDYLTLDLLYKQGLVDGEMIKKIGFAIEYDHQIYFGKIAFDPKVNFTRNNMIRMTAGFKF